MWFDVVGVIRARGSDVFIGIKCFGIYMDEYGNQKSVCVLDKLQSNTAIFPLRFIRIAVLLPLALLWKRALSHQPAVELWSVLLMLIMCAIPGFFPWIVKSWKESKPYNSQTSGATFPSPI